MPEAWGVDSLTPANFGPITHPRTGRTYPTLYDAVVSPDGASRTPEFWGRYIGTRGNLTLAEVNFLHSRNCKVLLIYRDTASQNAQIFTYQDGQNHANAAIQSAGLLQVPGGKRVWMYADIEFGRGFPIPTEAFFRGWSDTIANSPYGAGVYGNTAQAAAFSTPFCCAYNQDPVMRDPNAPAMLWTNQPGKCSGSRCDPRRYADPADLQPPFAPTIPRCDRLRPPCGPLIPPVVIYQYAIDFTINGLARAVDYDLANDMGFQGMWAPSRAWQGYLVPTNADELYSGIRQFDVLASGRIVLVAMKTSAPILARARYSDDNGATWSAAFDSSTLIGIESLGPMTVVERGGRIHIFLRGSGSDADLIYRLTFDPVGLTWGSPVVFFDGSAVPPGLGDFVRDFVAARRRNRTDAGVALYQFFSDTSQNSKVKYVSINADGTPGPVQIVDAGEVGVSGIGVLFKETGEPVVLRREEDKTLRTGTGYRKEFSDGWPISWTSFAIDDPPTVTPEIFFLIASVDNVPGAHLLWGGGSLDSQGDAHALRIVAGDPVTAVTYRRRVGGSWSESMVNFKSTNDCDPPISGAGTDSLDWHSMPILIDSGYAMCVIRLHDSSGNTSVWFVRRQLG